MKSTRLFGKIKKTQFTVSAFIINFLVFSIVFSLIGFALPVIFRLDIHCNKTIVLQSILVSVAYAYIDAQWNFTYFKGMMLLLVFLCLHVSFGLMLVCV